MNNLKLQPGPVYGPVQSRRIGVSLGVNISPSDSKYCSFNCVYCHYGWTKVLTTDPPPSFYAQIPDINELAEALELYDIDRDTLDHITFSGNGEATFHPQFAQAVELVVKFRNRCAPQAKTAILSNSATVHRPEIRQALLKLDRRIMKLDAGDETTFRRINRAPAQVKLENIISGLKALGEFESQSIFIEGHVSNSQDATVKAWIEVVQDLKPSSVQIYTLVRPPADKSLRPVSPQRMQEIYKMALSAGLPVELY